MINGQSIFLTNVRSGDREAMFSWMSDAETVRLNAPYTPLSWENHCRWFEAIGNYRDRVLFAVRTEFDGPIIGTVQFIDIHPVHRTTEMTVRIGCNSNRGKGLGTEAIKLAIKFVFDDLNLQRVWLRVFTTNKRAIRSYEKAGFTIEGTMRRAAYIQGTWVDEHVYVGRRRSTVPGGVAVNPDNGHCHIAYGLVAPVARTDAALASPLRLAAAVEAAYGAKLDADRGYSGLITKNPLHPHWHVYVPATEAANHGYYELAELAEYVTLPKQLPRRSEAVGIGRNVTISGDGE